MFVYVSAMLRIHILMYMPRACSNQVPNVPMIYRLRFWGCAVGVQVGAFKRTGKCGSQALVLWQGMNT